MADSKASAPVRPALWEAFKSGYSLANLRDDVAAGIVVGIVALPLSMALAIAVGLPPQHGLYTAIVGGALIALLGGSRTSVSGPTAAFVVILAPVVAKFGLGGLLLASVMAGVLLIVMGAARLGRLIEFVPHPVTTGFTSGIAVVIATLQIKDFLGLIVPQMPEHYLERVAALALALPTARWSDLVVGAATLAILLLWPRINRRVPEALIALTLVTVAAYGIHRAAPAWEVATINSRFQYESAGKITPGIPRNPPQFAWPWQQAGPGGRPLVLSPAVFRELALPAVAIAMLGAIESLLCAVVADGMTGQKHDPDAELIAQGVGNIVAPLFGGFAATAAIARTAVGIRAGARSPVSSIVHALTVLLAMVALAPLLGHLPMASLAALLLVVAWRMADVKHFARIVRVAPRSDTLVLATCFLLTIVFDMTVSVTAGVMLAALLFMQRMAELSNVRLRDGHHPQLIAPLPAHVRLYEIAGPLFFGAAEKAAEELGKGAGRADAVILYMGEVPTMDVTGLVALESAIQELQSHGAMVVLAGVRPQPAALLADAGIRAEPGRLSLCQSLEEAEILVRLAVPAPQSRR